MTALQLLVVFAAPILCYLAWMVPANPYAEPTLLPEDRRA